MVILVKEGLGNRVLWGQHGVRDAREKDIMISGRLRA